jgi:hypothetical protein
MANVRLANLEAGRKGKSNEQIAEELHAILQIVTLAKELLDESAEKLPKTWQDTITTPSAEIEEELTGLKKQLSDQLEALGE